MSQQSNSERTGLDEPLASMLMEYLDRCEVRVSYKLCSLAAPWRTGTLVGEPFTAEDGSRWQAVAPDRRGPSAPTTDTVPLAGSWLRIDEIVTPDAQTGKERP